LASVNLNKEEIFSNNSTMASNEIIMIINNIIPNFMQCSLIPCVFSTTHGKRKMKYLMQGGVLHMIWSHFLLSLDLHVDLKANGT